MTISIKIPLDTPFVRDGVKLRYCGEFMQGRMRFVPIDPESNLDAWTPSEEQFEKELAAANLKEIFVLKDANGDVVAEASQIDLPPGDETLKERRARSLFYFLKKWHLENAAGNRLATRHHPSLEKFVADKKFIDEFKKLGLCWRPSAGAMHRHLNKYPNITELTARFLISRSGEAKRQHWHKEVGQALEDIIHWYWAKSSTMRDYEDAYAEFYGRFDEIAIKLADDPTLLAPLKRPSRSTIKAYIDSAECYETVRDKFGEQAAEDQFTGNLHPVPASRLLEVVMIDSTILDSWCVLDDETLLPLGRPTLTVAVDVFTRMNLAAVVTFEPPSLFTAMACLKRINTPKHDIQERWPHIMFHNDGFGKPQTIIVDNELAQVGKSYQSACEDAKIHVIWAPVKRPQYKAIVERFFATLNTMLLQKLPGGMPFKPPIMRQLGIEPSEVSTITMSKLAELINQTINDLYNMHEHDTLRMSPALAWKKSKEKHKRPFIADVDFLERAFGAMGNGTLTTSGIAFDNMTFHDPAISGALMNDLKKTSPKRRRRRGIFSSGNPKVMFKYNPVNMEAINVWNSVSKKYVRLPNAAGDMAKGMSRWHWHVLRLWAAEEQLEFITPEQQMAARRRLRENIEATIPSEAYKSIKHQRRILHEPSEILEGKAIRMTAATATVGGMGVDDIEIVAAQYAPDGDRIPPKGPKRRQSKKTAPRTKIAQAPNSDRQPLSIRPSDRRVVKRDDDLADLALSIFAKRERIDDDR